MGQMTLAQLAQQLGQLPHNQSPYGTGIYPAMPQQALPQSASQQRWPQPGVQPGGDKPDLPLGTHHPPTVNDQWLFNLGPGVEEGQTPNDNWGISDELNKANPPGPRIPGTDPGDYAAKQRDAEQRWLYHQWVTQHGQDI